MVIFGDSFCRTVFLEIVFVGECEEFVCLGFV